MKERNRNKEREGKGWRWRGHVAIRRISVLENGGSSLAASTLPGRVAPQRYFSL